MMDVVFETLYFLQKDSFYKKIYYASRAFSALVTAQILINNQYPWSASITSWFQRILLWLSIPAQSVTEDQYIILLAITASIIFVCVGLYYFVCKEIHSGTMNNHRVTKFLRFLLGILVTLSNPVLSILLASANCDWIGGSNLSFIWDTTEGCSSARRVTEIIVSVVTFFPFIALVILSSVMHVSDPKSSMILSRAHSRVDVLSAMTDTVSNALAVFLNGYDGLLACIYILLQLSVTVSFIVFQPYYHTFTNDLFTLLAAETLWTGISFAVLTVTNDGGYIASVMLFAGALPFGVLAFWLSSTWRNHVVQGALEEYEDKTLDDLAETALTEEEVFAVLREKYDRNQSTFFMTDVKAALVELRTRFLLTDDSLRSIAIAEDILKRGMLNFPQSVYLRLQYVSFLLYYRNNPTLASVRLEEFAGLNVDLDLQFSVLRKKRDVERSRHIGHMGSGAIGMDSISFEEVKNRIKDARGLHKKAIELMEVAWKSLARKRGRGGKRSRHRRHRAKNQGKNRVHPAPRKGGELTGVGPQQDATATDEIDTAAITEAEILSAITPIIEELQIVVDKADKEYSLLWEQCSDSREVGTEYARYLRNIKRDNVAAEEIEDHFQQLGRDGGMSAHGSSLAGSSQTGSSKHTAEELQRRQKHSGLTASFMGRVSSLKLRLRIVTFFLMAGATLSFVSFYTISSSSIPVFESLVESGYRRYGCVTAAYQLRQMHLAAVAGDAGTFYRVRQGLNKTITKIRDIHFGLETTYRTTFARRNDFMSEQSVNVSRVGADHTILFEMIAPSELMRMQISKAFEALAEPMSLFASIKSAELSEFQQFHFVLDNHLECARAMDTATSLYLPELVSMLNIALQVIMIMCVFVGILELCTVLFLFRPAVNTVFEELAVCLWRFVRVPIETSKALAELELAHLNRFRVLAGDEVNGGIGDMGGTQMEEIDGNSAMLSSMNGLTVKIPSPKLRFAQLDGSPLSAADFHIAESPGAYPRTQSMHSESNAARQAGGSPSSLDSRNRSPNAQSPGTRKGSSSDRWDQVDSDQIASKHKRRTSDVAQKTPQSLIRISLNENTTYSDGSRPKQLEEHKSSGSSRRIPPPSDSEDESDFQGQIQHVTYDSVSDDDIEVSPCASDRPIVSIRPRRGSVGPISPPSPAGVPTEAPPPSVAATTWGRVLDRLMSLFCIQRTSHPMSRRKLAIIATNWAMLSVIFLCIIVVTVLGASAINNIFHAAPNVSNSSRRRYLFELCLMYGREIFLNVQPELSFKDSSLTNWQEADLRCLLSSAASLGVMLHYSVLFGSQEGMVKLPIARRLATPDQVANGACSPVTADVTLFDESVQMDGVSLHPLFSNFYFVPQCATTNSFAPNSIEMTNSRIAQFTKTLSADGCPYFLAGDAEATNGFHSLVDVVLTGALRLATTSTSTDAARDNYYEHLLDLQEKEDADTDLQLGLTKSVILAEGYSLSVILNNQRIMGAVYAVIMFMLIVQYFVIGKRIEVLMRNNLSATLTCERMLENAVFIMEKQGYTREECKMVIRSDSGNHDNDSEDEDEDEGEGEDAKSPGNVISVDEIEESPYDITVLPNSNGIASTFSRSTLLIP